MLTKELGIARLVDGQILPDRLSRTKHSQYVAMAKQKGDAYRDGVGTKRKQPT